MDATTFTSSHGEPRKHAVGINGLGNVMSVNASGILAMQQRHDIQVMATATSTISMTAVLCAIYWFAFGKRFYTGPIVEAEIDENESMDRSSNEGITKPEMEKNGDVVR